MSRPVVDVPPSAGRLVNSLRNIGYSFPSAVADLIDNSISAGATQVDVELVFDGERTYVLVADNGSGMTGAALIEAMRFGTRRDYTAADLGSFGLGLKTASLSQCRRLTVVTRRAETRRRLHARTLDLDHILETDRWEIIDQLADSHAGRSIEWLDDSRGTVVVWEHLDRVLPDRNPAGGWARRRIDSLSRRTAEHLGMVFHRFIEGTASDYDRLVITVDGEKVAPWNPFGPTEEHGVSMNERRVEVASTTGRGTVTFQPHVLPPKSLFSSLDEWERLSGPDKWNRQQGLYIYRADRMIQSGGWSGLRSADEHTKLARAALEFPTDLDELFGINVAKMRVSLPSHVKGLLKEAVAELCNRAQALYRHELHDETALVEASSEPHPALHATDASVLGASVLAAAFSTGHVAPLNDIIERLRADSPEVAQALGWD